MTHMGPHPTSDKDALRFDEFVVLPDQRTVLRKGHALKLGGRAFDLLVALAQSAGKPLSTAQLGTVAWPAVVVEESSLRTQVARLRRTFEDRAHLLVSVPGKGYMLDAQVTRLPMDATGKVEAPPQEDTECLAFGPFFLWSTKRRLTAHGRVLPIGSHAFLILTKLLSRPGEVVSKNELLLAAWPGGQGDEGRLRVHINALRKVFAAVVPDQHYIESVSGRGYCFASHVEPAMAPPEATPLGSSQSSLPMSPAMVVGREELIRGLMDRIPSQRLFTLCGPAGIGKSTAAIALARRLAPGYPDGIAYIDLSTYSDTRSTQEALAGMLGLPQEQAATWAPWGLLLAGRKQLVVLDNCDGVLGAIAGPAAALIRTAPGIDLIATSREPLRCEGEWVIRVPGLGYPPADTPINVEHSARYGAMQMLVQHANSNPGGFMLRDEDAELAGQLCRALEGVPWAIELAAVSMSVFGMRDLVHLGEDLLHVLHAGPHTATPRHANLDMLVGWSCDRLTEMERDLLANLSTLRDGFTIESVQSLPALDMATAADVGASLASLVSKSLLHLDSRAEPPQFRLAATTRAYAVRRLRKDSNIRML
jgi:predicted ATPase/DNA-binding winged helix-turn-helix (wHTH) protein